MIDLVMKLYPRAWRERYEDEFRALLEDTGCPPSTAVNVAACALRMQVRYRHSMMATIAFLAGFVGLEIYAVRHDVTENIFWLPRSLTSLVVLLAVVGCLVMAARPLWVFVARKVSR